MARIPAINADDSMDEAIGGSTLYMFDKDNDKLKNATWDFLKFLCSVDVSAYWYVNSGYFPANNDAYNTKLVQDLWAKDSQYKIMPTVLTDGAKNYKFQSPFTPNLSNYDTTIQNNAVLVANGKRSVDEAVKAITKAADDGLAKYWAANKK
jgi:ABC-type glycerol-3-phosphate transport system substrate-binding protein